MEDWEERKNAYPVKCNVGAISTGEKWKNRKKKISRELNLCFFIPVFHLSNIPVFQNKMYYLTEQYL